VMSIEYAKSLTTVRMNYNVWIIGVYKDVGKYKNALKK
jgi:hypothetical protein